MATDVSPEADEPQPPAGPVRALLHKRRASHSHGFVLALVVATFIFAATAGDAAWTSSVLVLLQSAAFVAALWTSGLADVDSRLSRLFLAVAVLVAVLNLVVEGETLTAIAGLLSGLLAFGIAFVIAASVLDQPRVNAQSVIGAICIYLLLGMIFMFAYGVIAALASGPFFTQGTDGTRSIRMYFSYITMTTVGYGDYTAAGNLGRTLSASEALFGQLYLVTVVAVVVSRLGRRREPRAGRGERAD